MKNFSDLLGEKTDFEINMKSEKGHFTAKISGNKISLMSGLSTLIEELQKNGFSKEDIEMALKIGFKSKEEKQNEIKSELNKILNTIMSDCDTEEVKSKEITPDEMGKILDDLKNKILGGK